MSSVSTTAPALRDQVLALVDAGQSSGAWKAFGPTPGLCVVTMSELVHMLGRQKAGRRIALSVGSALDSIPEVGYFPAQLPNNGTAHVCLYRLDQHIGRTLTAILAAPQKVDGSTAAALVFMAANLRPAPSNPAV
ncbi:hypothetical protein [Kitasatospora sp. NPDC085879]|uniref:hypothetical protein n=1 Tax=Kitasatospora sp. NPDC085879 TaxID=3154769 RepID=UPI003449F97C